jgi:putative hydrolase of the HAD superfamily
MLVGVDTFGYGKPAPEVFLAGCERLGTDPGRTVYVGDELDVDAAGAASAGLIGVWLDRPGTRRGGVHVEDPAALLGAIGGGGVGDGNVVDRIVIVSALTDLPAALGVAGVPALSPARGRGER